MCTARRWVCCCYRCGVGIQAKVADLGLSRRLGVNAEFETDGYGPVSGVDDDAVGQ